MWKVSLGVAASLLVTGAANAAGISTLNSVTGEATPWEQATTATYGQTVTFDEPVELKSFEFRSNDKGTAITYSVSVYAWDGNDVTGAALFSGSGITAGESHYANNTTDMSGLLLSPGQYVVLLEATSAGSATFATADSGYSGGSWVYWDKGSDAEQSESWYVSLTSDLGFRLDYDDKPN